MTKLCEKALIQHLVTAGKLDGEDGWGEFIPLCREYSNTRAHPKAQAFFADLAGVKIGPVLEVHIVTILERMWNMQKLQCHHLQIPSNPENVLCRDIQRN